MPFSDDFESPSSLPGIDGWIENLHNDSVVERTNAANTTPGGSWCMTFNDFSNPPRELNSWVTPSIDFSNTGFTIHVEFNVAYAQKSGTDDDRLTLFYSTDCGYTWTSTTYSKRGANLSTAPMTNGLFIPSNNAQWRHETVTCNAVQFEPNVRFKFENQCRGGNNIYIDDLMITGAVAATGDLALSNGMNLYPNPASGTSVLEFHLLRPSDVKCMITNTLGQHVADVMNGKLPRGENKVVLPSLKAGMYFVSLTVNNEQFVRRLTVCTPGY
jgi:hypothetical protein